MADEDRDIEVHFHNITVTFVGVKTAREAYGRLCKALGAIDESTEDVQVDWMTDTYSTGDLGRRAPNLGAVSELTSR